jgi:hypothetical protein
MDGFTGFKTATQEELPDATPVTGPVPCRAGGGRRFGPVPSAGPTGLRLRGVLGWFLVLARGDVGL